MKLQRSLSGEQLISPVPTLRSQPAWVDVIQATALQQNSHLLAASVISQDDRRCGAVPQVGTV